MVRVLFCFDFFVCFSLILVYLLELLVELSWLCKVLLTEDNGIFWFVLRSGHQEDDANELYCRVCNQYFSSLHNKKEHLFGKQHLLMLTGEFEREVEQNASGNDKVVNDSTELPVTDTVHVGHSGGLVPAETEPVLSISQFTEKFLEQNLSESNLLRLEFVASCTYTGVKMTDEECSFAYNKNRIDSVSISLLHLSWGLEIPDLRINSELKRSGSGGKGVGTGGRVIYLRTGLAFFERNQWPH